MDIRLNYVSQSFQLWFYHICTTKSWQRGNRWRTTKPSTSLLKGGWGRRETRQTGAAMIQGPTRWRFRQGRGLGPAQWKGAVSRRWRGRQWGCNYGTVTSRTQWWSWRRATSSIHGAPCVTCWCRGRTWMGRTGKQHNALGEQSGGDGD